MTHVVASHLARTVRQTLREHGGRAVQQQARAFQRIARHRHDAGLLPLLLAAAIDIHHAGDLAPRIVFDPQRHRVRSHLEIAGRLTLGDLGVQRGPLAAGLAALEAEADLLAGAAIVPRLAVDRHVAGVHFLVAKLARTRFQDLVVVVAGQARDAVGPRRAHLVLGLRIPRLHLGERDRPIGEVRAGDIAVGAARLELVILEAQRGAGPMHRRAADRLDDPCRQIGEVVRHAPRARRGAHVLPGELRETRPFVVDEVGDLVCVRRPPGSPP